MTIQPGPRLQSISGVPMSAFQMARLGGQLQTNQQAGRYLSKVEHQREQRDRLAVCHGECIFSTQSMPKCE